MNLNELAKTREWLTCLKLRSDISLGEKGYRNIDIALTALDALLNAGEVLPPLKETDGKWKSEFQYLLDRKILSRDELSYLFEQIKSIIEQEMNLARSEDTAILARKMMGLEEVIRQVPLFEDGIGQDEGYNVGVEINEESVNKLAQAITQHLKGVK